MNLSKVLTAAAIGVVGIVASASSALAGSNGIKIQNTHRYGGGTSHQSVNFNGTRVEHSNFSEKTKINEFGTIDGVSFQKDKKNINSGTLNDTQTYVGNSVSNSWENSSSKETWVDNSFDW